MKKIIQTIKLRRLKTEFNKEIIEDQNRDILINQDEGALSERK